MDHPDHIIELTSINRQSGMTAIAHHFRDVGDCGRCLDGAYVRARHHNVFDGDIADTQNVPKESKLFRIVGARDVFFKFY